MRIVITGNMGYVGPTVVRYLRNEWPDAEIVGYDAGYFAHCLTGTPYLPEITLDKQIFGDTRSISPDLVKDTDIVIHLAAVSNDPMGDRYAEVTKEINEDTSVHLAKLAAEAGVKHFVFASSCSVYGVAEGGARTETDPLNPVTAYAKSKIGTEERLANLSSNMTVTCLRFATACGMSPRLRLDLVLNDFVASAISTGSITVLSDGTPWRPLIDTQDMARAIVWAACREEEVGGKYLAVNAGSNDCNYQIAELAEEVAREVGNVKVSINTDAPADSRSYQVDFSLFERLAPDFQPQIDLQRSIRELHDGLRAMKFSDQNFRTSSLIRLHMLEAHRDEGRLGDDLRWIS